MSVIVINIKQSTGWCHDRRNNQRALTSRRLVREDGKNLVTEFSFCIGDEKKKKIATSICILIATIFTV